jgi:hypothetical protein
VLKKMSDKYPVYALQKKSNIWQVVPTRFMILNLCVGPAEFSASTSPTSGIGALRSASV